MTLSLGKLARRLGLYRGRRLFGRLIFRPESLYSVWQEEHLAQLFEFLQVDCVFDVGANCGEYAMMLRERLEFAGPIISFEPIPNLAGQLREQARGDANWRIEELALTSEDGHTVFNVMEVSEFSSIGTPSHEDSGLFRRLNAVEDSIVVATETLATALARLQKEYGFSRPFLKLDTQGFDVAIATASPEALREFVALQTELAFKRLYEESVGFDTALRSYGQCGFVPATFMGINPGHFPIMVETDCLLVREDLLPDSLA